MPIKISVDNWKICLLFCLIFICRKNVESGYSSLSLLIENKLKASRKFNKMMMQTYEGHPINRGNFLIIQEFLPVKHRKCNHKVA